MITGSDPPDRSDWIVRSKSAGFSVPLLPAVVVIGLALTKNPPLPSLFAGVLAGAAVAIFWQGYGLHDVFAFAQSGYSIDTGIADIDSLLNSGQFR